MVMLTLDRAGRVVIPRALRRQLRLDPGDTLALETHGEQMTLKPVRQAVGLQKEMGVWVYRSAQAEVDPAQGLVDRDREARIRELGR
jgi:AbrB family looped-hinge helix DNA binding protein